MRLFIATTFPDAVTRDLADRVSRVKSKLPASSWVRPESQHLTFAFLGEQSEEVVGKLVPLVEEQLAPQPAFEGSLRTCGFFPNPRHARVAWVGVGPEDQFCSIAAAVREAVKEAGIALDGAEFRPHLTLCRIRTGWPPACVDIFQRALRDFASAAFTIDQVTLFSSQLNPGGAIHTPLRQFRLGAAKGVGAAT